MQSSFTSFCSRYPALIAALFFLLGLAFSKGIYIPALLPLFFISFFLGKQSLRKTLILLLVSSIAFFYGKYKEPFFPNNAECIEGMALFIPSDIKSHSSHFKKTTYLKGTIKEIQGTQVRNIPCSFLIPKNHPPINKHYHINGTLRKKQGNNPSFYFTPDQNTIWEPIKYTFVLTEKRFQTKKFLAKHMRNLFSSSKVATFMIALSIGELDDRMLTFDFGKLGLQHILAISGFHFGLLALLLGNLIRFFLPNTNLGEKIGICLLLGILTTYFLLVGNSPSILRAYLAIFLYLIGKLGRWNSSGLNIFGTVLFIEIFLNPQVISHLGFQFSFLATFAILHLLPMTTSWMFTFFPYRTLAQALQMRSIDKWSYLLCSFLRSTFALNLAVHLAITPLCLFYFQQFPLMSLAYNLFIPLGVSISLSLLFISIPCLFVLPPFGLFCIQCNELFTTQILQLISQAPLCFDLSIRLNHLPLWALSLFLFLLFSLPFLKTKNHLPLIQKSLPH